MFVRIRIPFFTWLHLHIDKYKAYGAITQNYILQQAFLDDNKNPISLINHIFIKKEVPVVKFKD